MAYTNKPSKPNNKPNNNTNRPNNRANQPWSPRPEKSTSNKVSRGQRTKVTQPQTLNQFYPQSIINWTMKQLNSSKTTKVTNVTPNLNSQKYSALDNLLTTYTDPNSPFNNLTMTANGANAYKTSGSKLVDINFAIGELRSASEENIIKKFRDAFDENPEFALKWLFWLGDVRRGSGEKRAFRVIIVDLAKNGLHEFVNNMIPMIAEYTRFDVLWELFDTPCEKAMINYVKKQLKEDIQAHKNRVKAKKNGV